MQTDALTYLKKTYVHTDNLYCLCIKFMGNSVALGL